MTTFIHFTETGEHCGEVCPCEHRTKYKGSALYQDETWTTREGEEVLIEDMEPRHAHHTYWFLHRRSRSIAFRQTMADCSGPWAPQGEMANDAFDVEMDERNDTPHIWLDTLEQTRALALRALDYYAPRPLPWRCEEPSPGKPDPADAWMWVRDARGTEDHAPSPRDRNESLCRIKTLDYDRPPDLLPHPRGRCRYCLRAIYRLNG